MQFIDTHCHLDDESYGPDVEEVIGRALAAGVAKMAQADIDSRERARMLELCASHPGALYPMLGLYPGSVKANWKEELDEVFRCAEKWRAATGCGRDAAQEGPDYIAIGEIGLDYHFTTEYKEQQKEALKAQLELAAALGLPVNIHLRDATNDFFDILEGCRGLALRGNLHAFGGSAETAARIRRYGDWSVGLGGVLTFKKAGIARAAADIPLEMIVLETDAPYLTPTPYRGTRNESAYIPLIAAKLAEIKGISIEEVARATTTNALRLFPRLEN